MNNKSTFKQFVYAIAFIAIICIALALVLQVCFKGQNANIVKIFKIIGEVVAFTITCSVAFMFVKNKQNVAWKIIYAIAVTAIFVLVIVVNIL